MAFDLYNYFINEGWSPTAAAGIVGNAYGESGLNAGAVGDGGLAHGLFQIHSKWHPGYDRDFNAQQQASFVSNELKTKYPALTRALNSMSNVADATRAFMTGYEKPASMGSLGTRISAALDTINGKTVGKGIRAGVAVATGGTSELALGAADLLGLGPDSCGWICQFRQWLDESHFWQRIAIGFMAIIILAIALWMLGNKMNINVGKQ